MLRGDWFWAQVRAGDCFNVVSPSCRFCTDIGAAAGGGIYFDTDPPPMSDDDDLLFVLHPDKIVSPSYISDQLACQRRAVLKHRMKGSSYNASFDGLLGSCRHELFQQVIGTSDVRTEAVETYADAVARAHSEELVAHDSTEEQVSGSESRNDLLTVSNVFNTSSQLKEKVLEIMPHVRDFLGVYWADGGGFINTSVDVDTLERMSKYNSRDDVLIKVNQVDAIEEEIVSPALGLSGHIDVTMQAEIIQGGETSSVLVPLELKTGKKQDIRPDHTAQLSLYTLMLRSGHGTSSGGRSGGAADGGVLLYLNENGWKAAYVSPNAKEVKTLMSQRNDLASNILESESIEARNARPGPPGLGSVALPPVDEDKTAFNCTTCFSRNECTLYKKVEMSVSGEDRTWLREWVEGKSDHLTVAHLRYFEEWDRMLDLELSETSHLDRIQALIEESQDREVKTKKSISRLKFFVDEYGGQDAGNEGEDVLLRFERDMGSATTLEMSSPVGHSQASQGGSGFQKLYVDKGDKVIVSSDTTIFKYAHKSKSSSERRELCIVLGEVKRIASNFIEISCAVNFAKKLEKFCRRWKEERGTPSFRMDLNEYPQTVGRLRENLLHLVLKNRTRRSDSAVERIMDPSLQLLRELIVDFKPPVFIDVGDGLFSNKFHVPMSVHCCDLFELAMEFNEQLNHDQQAAVRRVAGAENYALIQVSGSESRCDELRLFLTPFMS